MNRRILMIALAATLSGAASLRAQFIWSGGSSVNGDVGDAANWQAHSPTTPVGNGTEDVVFGDISGGAKTTVLLSTAGLHDITFNGSERPGYVFSSLTGTQTLTLAGKVTMGSGSDVTFDSTLNITLASGAHIVDVTNSNATLNVASAIGGTGSITKNGPGTLSLTGTNAFSGGIQVNAGTLRLEGNTAGGSGTLSFSDTTTLAVTTNSALSNALVLAGTVNLGDDSTASNITLGGIISGSGILAYYGGGNLTIAASNPGWSGGLQLNSDGYIYANTDNALGTGPLTFDSSSSATVVFSTANAHIGSLSGGYNNGEGSGSTINLSTGATNLVVNQTTDGTYDGNISGSGGFQKSGSAKLTLNGYGSNYTGTTTINGGTLVATSNGVLGSGTVYVTNATLVLSGVNLYNNVIAYSGGKLAGNGFTNSATINSGGILSPGLSCPIGTLSFNDLTLGTGGIYEWNFKDASNYDYINVQYSSTLTIAATSGSPFTIKVVSLDSGDNPGMATGFVFGQTYDFTLFDTNGISGFAANKFVFDTSQFSTDGGAAANFTISQSGSSLILSFTPVPEPSTWALLGAGLGVAALTHRRRQRA